MSKSQSGSARSILGLKIGQARGKRGTSLALVIALGFAALAISWFALTYIRQIGSHQEQNTAIEAAALVAAKDLGRIIIKDPCFGYVGLLDHAPQGVGIAAPDGFGVPVRSINSIMATIRLDMIIADRLQNQRMKALAFTDYENARLVVSKLKVALTDSLSANPGAKYTDAAGLSITPYKDALTAYTTNLVRMQGPSQLVKESLDLQLGYSLDTTTSTPIPINPGPGLELSSVQQVNGFYKAGANVPYANYPFIFTALSDQPTLIGGTNFVSQMKGLNNVVPSAVRAQANHQFGVANQASSSVIQDATYAQVGGPADSRPAPGAMALTFPDGCPTEINTLQAFLTETANLNPGALYYSLKGDYPIASAQRTYVSVLMYPQQGSASNLQIWGAWNDSMTMAIYMWLKRAGPFVNVQSVINTMNSNFWPKSAPQSASLMVVYTFDTTTGAINSSTLACEQIYASNSDAQIMASSGNELACSSVAQSFDLIVSYNVFQPTGMHGGEPIVDRRFTANPPYIQGFQFPTWPTPKTNTSVSYGWASQWGGWAFNKFSLWGRPWPAGGDNTAQILYPQPTSASPGALRPTYNTNGLAVEIALHRTVFQRVGNSPSP